MAAETPEQRVARLEALRLAAELSEKPDDVPEAEATATNGGANGGEHTEDEPAEEPGPVIRFRNYVPRDESLHELKVAPPKALTFEDPTVKASDESGTVEEPVFSIAPKKANWDLRRDVTKKLEKLEKRTQRAIIQLMQQEEERRQAAAREEEAEMVE